MLLENILQNYEIDPSKKLSEQSPAVQEAINKIETMPYWRGFYEMILIKRKYPPFQNFYALPGGFIKENEKLKDALLREVKEETNLDVQIITKIGVYDEEGRDPRGNIHSTAFKCIVTRNLSSMKSGENSEETELIPIERLKDMELAFDHKKILKDANLL